MPLFKVFLLNKLKIGIDFIFLWYSYRNNYLYKDTSFSSRSLSCLTKARFLQTLIRPYPMNLIG